MTCLSTHVLNSFIASAPAAHQADYLEVMHHVRCILRALATFDHELSCANSQLEAPLSNLNVAVAALRLAISRMRYSGVVFPTAITIQTSRDLQVLGLAVLNCDSPTLGCLIPSFDTVVRLVLHRTFSTLDTFQVLELRAIFAAANGLEVARI